MKFGPKSDRTAPEPTILENRTRHMAPSRRHADKIALGNKRVPFCHHVDSRTVVEIPRYYSKDADKGPTKRTYPHKKTLPYHATKGYRKVSSKRL